MLKSTAIKAGALLVSFDVDRLDAGNAPEFREAAFALVDSGQANLVFDMSNLKYVDSSGLGALVGLLKRVGVKGDVKLFGLAPAVLKVFSITRMNKVFNIFESLDKAVSVK